MKKIVKILILFSVSLLVEPLSASDRHVLTLTESNFQKTIMGEKPVLVKFWASWCRPCLQMAPRFKQVAGSYVGKVVFAEVNIDSARAVANAYNVRSVPTTILFMHGKEMDRVRGSLNRRQLDYWAGEIVRGRYE